MVRRCGSHYPPATPQPSQCSPFHATGGFDSVGGPNLCVADTTRLNKRARSKMRSLWDTCSLYCRHTLMLPTTPPWTLRAADASSDSLDFPPALTFIGGKGWLLVSNLHFKAFLLKCGVPALCARSADGGGGIAHLWPPATTLSRRATRCSHVGVWSHSFAPLDSTTARLLRRCCLRC